MKAKALKKGDLISIIAPASAPVASERIEKSVTYFERLGYRVTLGKHLQDEYGYLAGTDKSRVADLHTAFRDPKVRAIFYIRGGYGSARLLEEIDFDLIAKNPKIIVGYSDATALFLALYKKSKLGSMFLGPMPGVDIWNRFDPFAEENFWRALTSTAPLGALPMNDNEGILFGKIKKFAPITSRIFGGNLAVFSTVCGTEFMPSLKNCALLFEEVGERVYRVDRFLSQLKNMRALSNASAVLLGQFTEIEMEKGKPSLSLNEVFEDYFGKLDIPVILNLPTGHIARQWTLPFGAKYKIEAAKSHTRISVIESNLA